MKEQELDKYINKYVEIVDFENKSYKGRWYKINNFMYNVGKDTRQAIINKGYILDVGDRYINYRKSHIKKIKKI